MLLRIPEGPDAAHGQSIGALAREAWPVYADDLAAGGRRMYTTLWAIVGPAWSSVSVPGFELAAEQGDMKAREALESLETTEKPSP